MKTYKTILALIIIVPLFLLIVSFSVAQTDAPQGWHKAGSNPNDYQMEIVSDVKHGGNGSVIISSLKDDIDGFGTYMQTFKADKYHGKRIKLTGWIKTKSVNSAQMWMRLDGKEGMPGFDNMDNRPIKGTQDWQECSIVLDIPEETVFIAFGTFVIGYGTAWVDDYSFEVVDTATPTTNMLNDGPTEMTEEQKAYHENYIKMNYPDEPDNLACDM